MLTFEKKEYIASEVKITDIGVANLWILWNFSMKPKYILLIANKKLHISLASGFNGY